jgi:hypothetical protein
MRSSVTVTVSGVEFEVEGEYTTPTPAHIAADPDDSYPADGGLDDATIKIGGQEVGEVLLAGVFNAVIEAAEQAMGDK